MSSSLSLEQIVERYFRLYVHNTRVWKGWDWVILPDGRKVSVSPGKYLKFYRVEEDFVEAGFEDLTEEIGQHPDYDYDEPVFQVRLLGESDGVAVLEVKIVKYTAAYTNSLYVDGVLLWTGHHDPVPATYIVTVPVKTVVTARVVLPYDIESQPARCSLSSVRHLIHLVSISRAVQVGKKGSPVTDIIKHGSGLLPLVITLDPADLQSNEKVTVRLAIPLVDFKKGILKEVEVTSKTTLDIFKLLDPGFDPGSPLCLVLQAESSLEDTKAKLNVTGIFLSW